MISYRIKVIAVIVMHVLLAFMGPTYAFASCDVGLEVTAGKFDLRIVYNCGVDKPDEGIRYMQDSSCLLFDLVALFQRNYKELSAIDRSCRVDMMLPEDDENDTTAKELLISWEDAQTGPGGAIKTVPFQKLTIETFRRHVCALIPVANCVLGRDDRSYLYKRRKSFELPYPDAILFGSFPSDSMPKKYVLRPPAGKETDFKKVNVTRKDMKKYFGILE